jgi:5,10-methylenetetrahydrofolate reductase
MLTRSPGWLDIAEVNPPVLPNTDHLRLRGAWSHVLVTDNVFGKIRSSPYAYAARLGHDVPEVHSTVVVSTRDRNILAIESEVRGALGNGVDSFLVVVGDTVPAVDHLAHHHEVVEHMSRLKSALPIFEVGMPTRFAAWQFRRRVDLGADFFVAGPVLDPETVEPQVGALRLRPGDPPVYLMVIPPFSLTWVERVQGFGAVPAGDGLRARLASFGDAPDRAFGWDRAAACAERARQSGCRGVVLMGLKAGTVTGEGPAEWWQRFPDRRPQG